MREKIEKYKNHWIDSNGYVYKINKRGEEIKLNGVYHKDDELRVLLTDGRCTENGHLIWEVEKLSHLVLNHFSENPNNYSHVRYLDENKRNCSIENLEWISEEEYDTIRRTYEGRTLYEIPEHLEYYVTEDGKVYSDKGGTLSEMNHNNYGVYALQHSYKDELLYKRPHELLDMVEYDNFSRKELESKIEAHRNKISEKLSSNSGASKRVVKVVHLKTGNVYDSILDAEEASGTSAANISVHCSNGVSKPRWCYYKDKDEYNIENEDVDIFAYEKSFSHMKNFEHIPTNTEYDSLLFAIEDFDIEAKELYDELESRQSKEWQYVQ